MSATFVRETYPTRRLYDLGETFSTPEVPEFSHAIVSTGRDGDTCAFPASPEGKVLSFNGFGYEFGPDRWLLPDEQDAYIAACAEVARDGGRFIARDWQIELAR